MLIDVECAQSPHTVHCDHTSTAATPVEKIASVCSGAWRTPGFALQKVDLIEAQKHGTASMGGRLNAVGLHFVGHRGGGVTMLVSRAEFCGRWHV